METNVVKAVNTVNVEWVILAGRKSLRITIRGRLTEKTATKAIAEWKEAFALNQDSGQKQIVICSCLKMTGYETEARKMWQQTISELKSELECMWIVTNNKLFILAAKTMGLVTKFKLRTVSSEDDIHYE